MKQSTLRIIFKVTRGVSTLRKDSVLRKPAGLLMLALAVVLLAACLAFVFAQRLRDAAASEQRPRRALAGSPRIINVKAKENLQAAIDAAQAGDTIVLEAGASYVGPFTLPDKGSASSDYITIRSSAPAESLPSPGQRITSAFAALLPKILSPGQSQPALMTAPAAHHYRFIAVEFRTTNAAANVSDLIKLGDGSPAQHTLASVPHHLSFDRCVITAFPTQTLKRGIALNSAETEIVNCWITGFKAQGQDSQGIGGWNGPGPYHIINNYVEAAGENVLIGGAAVSIPNLVPSDIEVRRNFFTKPLSWKAGEPDFAGVVWSVKNLFELKNARRVVVDGNIFENNWVESQSGFAIVLTVRADNPWATIEEVDFTNNIVRHTASAFNILGHDTLAPSAIGHGLRIKNNLLEDIGGARWGGDGNSGMLLKLSEMAGTIVEHNTALQTGNITTVYGPVSAGLEMRNNITLHNEYGIIGDSKGSGMSTISAFFPGGAFQKNVIAGADASKYPSGNFYPETINEVGFVDRAHGNYRLSASSRYRRAGTDGKDLGCDFDALNAAMQPPN